jgi:hypothetical protein
MEHTVIKQRVLDLFNGADERNWGKVKMAFADNVLLDYSSLSGNLLRSNHRVKLLMPGNPFCRALIGHIISFPILPFRIIMGMPPLPLKARPTISSVTTAGLSKAVIMRI